MVSYALDHKSEINNEVQVIGEDIPDVVTYSRALTIVLTRFCRNNCPYCGFKKQDNLVVPYSTIKASKIARQNGIREALFVGGEWPDRSPHIRATLDLWGFASYSDYLYTICELSFLEGLIPVIDVGFMSPKDMARMAEISAVFKIMLDAVDPKFEANFYQNSPGKRHEVRLKLLTWTGKLKIPTATGIMVGVGETNEYRKRLLEQIADIHKQFGNIQEVTLQNFMPDPRTKMKDASPPTKETMLKVTELALKILPPDIKIIVPYESNPDIEDFLKLGIRDIGRISEGQNIYLNKNYPVDFKDAESKITALGLVPQQRFPLHLNFIKDMKYSKKLGQVFDAYRYKIKKEELEKMKDAKVIGNDSKK